MDIEDLYGKADVEAVQGPGVRIVQRPPFDVGYVGMNQQHEPFDRQVVRQAVALGLDRAAVVADSYTRGAAVAHEFTPPSLAGYAASAGRLRYDPQRARALLRQAGLTLPVPIELRYPTGIRRPYLPDPHAIARRFAASLERAGFSVSLGPEPWLPDYLRRVRTGGAALYLLGWIGDYADAGAFLQPLFGPESTGFGFTSVPLERLLERADAEPSPPARAVALPAREPLDHAAAPRCAVRDDASARRPAPFRPRVRPEPAGHRIARRGLDPRLIRDSAILRLRNDALRKGEPS